MKIYPLALGLILTFIVVTFPALKGPLMFDDFSSIINNAWVVDQDGSFESLRAATLSGIAGPLKRPIAMLSFALHSAIPGFNSIVAMKAVGVLLHLSIGWLIFRILGKLFVFRDSLSHRQCAAQGESLPSDSLIPLLCTALWVLHPLHVSTVFYVVQRMTQLSMVFSLAALLCYVNARFRWLYSRPQWGDIVGTSMWLGLFVLLAMLCKENALLILPVIAVCEYLLFRGEVNSKPTAWLFWCAFAGALAVPVGVLCIVFLQPDWVVGGYASREFTFPQRLITEAGVIVAYLGWLLFPRLDAFTLYHDDWSVVHAVSSPQFYLPALLLVGMLAVIVVFRRRAPLVAAGLAIFLLGHTMESTVLALELAFEHRNYLPSFGLAMVAMSLFHTLAQRLSIRVCSAAAVAILMVFSLQLHFRSLTWSNSFQLHHFMATANPQSYRSQVDYAALLLANVLDSPDTAATSVLASDQLTEVGKRLWQADALSPQRLRHLSLLVHVEVRFGGDYKALFSLLDRMRNNMQHSAPNAADTSALITMTGLPLLPSCSVACGQSVTDFLVEIAHRYPQVVGLRLALYELGRQRADESLLLRSRAPLANVTQGSLVGSPLIDDALQERQTALALERLRAGISADTTLLGAHMYRLYAQTIDVQLTERMSNVE